MELRTPQEEFETLYHKQVGRTADLRYKGAVIAFRKVFRLKEPFTSHESFKVTMSKKNNHEKKNKS